MAFPREVTLEKSLLLLIKEFRESFDDIWTPVMPDSLCAMMDHQS